MTLLFIFNFNSSVNRIAKFISIKLSSKLKIWVQNFNHLSFWYKELLEKLTSWKPCGGCVPKRKFAVPLCSICGVRAWATVYWIRAVCLHKQRPNVFYLGWNWGHESWANKKLDDGFCLLLLKTPYGAPRSVLLHLECLFSFAPLSSSLSLSLARRFLRYY